jgi:hypothetical protein
MHKVKTAISFVKLVRKRIKQMFSGSLEKQSLTLFPVYYDNFSNLDSSIVGGIVLHNQTTSIILYFFFVYL